MRVFVAVPVPAPVREVLRPAVAALVARWPDLRWTDLEGWHLTLAFLGEVDDPTAAAVVAGVAEVAAGLHPVDITLAAGAEAAPGGGRFGGRSGDRSGGRSSDRTGGRRGRGGIVWVQAHARPGALEAVAQAVRDACDRAGAPPDRRPLRPHVTLCRVPRGHDADPQATAEAVARAHHAPTVGWTADVVAVVRSHRTATGARYEDLAVHRLGGAVGEP